MMTSQPAQGPTPVETPNPAEAPKPDPQEARDPARKPLTDAARRALAEAEERRAAYDAKAAELAKEAERGGGKGPDPVRYGDWERNGIASDF